MINRFIDAFKNNWNLKVGALITTIVITFIVHGDNPSSVTTSIPLRVTIPKSTVLSEELPDRASITIGGSYNQLKGFDPSKLKPIVIKLEENENRSVVSIPVNQIELPSGLRVTQITPEYIPVKLEPRAYKRVPVRARLIGSPTNSYAVQNISETPDTIEVSGPQKVLDQLPQLFTEPMSLSDLTGTVTKKLHVVLDDPLLEFEEEPLVDVKIEVSKAITRATFAKIPVIAVNSNSELILIPKEISINVSGPLKDIEEIGKNELKAIIDLKDYDPKLGNKTTLPPRILNLPQQVSIDDMSSQEILVEVLPEPELPELPDLTSTDSKSSETTSSKTSQTLSHPKTTKPTQSLKAPLNP